MELITALLILAAVIAICVLLFKIISTPLRLIFKLLINAAFGFVILFIVNFFGDFIGISVGVSFFNAVIAGVFGVPGVILLILVRMFI